MYFLEGGWGLLSNFFKVGVKGCFGIKFGFYSYIEDGKMLKFGICK